MIDDCPTCGKPHRGRTRRCEIVPAHAPAYSKLDKLACVLADTVDMAFANFETGHPIPVWNWWRARFNETLRMNEDTMNEKSTLVEVGRTSRGYTLYREPNEAGGHRYWSDAIGGGVAIWDTCLASADELETAIRIERGQGRKVYPRPTITFGMYRHHKGGFYEAYGVSRDEASGVWFVLYRNPTSGEPFHRPYSEWAEKFVYQEPNDATA